MAMQIKFLGTGGAFDFAKGNASAIVTLDSDTNILIDCGFSTLKELADKDLMKTIDYILVTHLHGDHIGSLPTLLPYVAFRLQKEIPKIIVPDEAFETELHQFFTATYEAERASYVPMAEFPELGYIDTSNQHLEGMRSFAYYFTNGTHLIYYSGDIGNADTAQKFLADRTESNIQVFHETTPRLDVPVHASYKEVEEKLGDYDTYAYHIDKADMPDDCALKLVEDHPEFLA